MKFKVEVTKEVNVELCNKELFDRHLKGVLKESFWDYVDDYEGVVENIVHQFHYEGDGFIQELDGKVYRVKHLEGFGYFFRHPHDPTEWVNGEEAQAEIGKIVIIEEGDSNYYVEEV